MDERTEEINCVVNMMDKMCRAAGIALIPAKLPNGVHVVGIYDNKTGKTHALMEEKGDTVEDCKR